MEKSSKKKLTKIKDEPIINTEPPIDFIPSIDELINNFELLITFVQTLDDKTAVFKIREYVDAINILKGLPADLPLTMDNIKKRFTEFGKKNPVKIYSKINEYLSYGKISEVEEIRNDPHMRLISLFIDLYGVGIKKAIDIVDNKKIKSIPELKEFIKSNPKYFNDKQKIGLKYYDDLQERIPRSDIDAFNELLLNTLKEIDKKASLVITGSYRRGKSSSGDIDILITTPDDDVSILKNKLIKALQELDILKETLADGVKKFMGICEINHKFRHVDILATTPKEYPFASLYFTGSKKFNTIMRSWALDQGYSLNEYGLIHKLTGIKITSDEIKLKIGKDKFENEHDIFDFLDFEYKSPSERDLS